MESFKGSLKAFFDSLDAQIFVFQETKIGSNLKEVKDDLLHIDGYESFWSPCKKRPGYSGVVTYVKTGLTVDARCEFGNPEFDCEGRIMMTDHGSFLLFNVYFPNSGNGDRLDYKMDFYRWFENICDGYLKEGRQIVIAGDVNTTHRDIDIWCPEKLEQGLFAEERKWMDHLFTRIDTEPFVDSFRELHPFSRKYSWWDVKSNLRITDQGYRLDYFLLNKKFFEEVLQSDMMTEQLGSDHCPIFLTLKPQTVPAVSKPPTLSSDLIKARQPKISSFFKPKSQSAPIAIAAPSAAPSDPSNTNEKPVAANETTQNTATQTSLGLSEPNARETIREKRERDQESALEDPEPKRPKLAEPVDN